MPLRACRLIGISSGSLVWWVIHTMHAVQASAEGRLREIFGCGTACIVQPVDGLVRANGEVLSAPFDASNITSMTARMTRALTDIQYAR